MLLIIIWSLLFIAPVLGQLSCAHCVAEGGEQPQRNLLRGNNYIIEINQEGTFIPAPTPIDNTNLPTVSETEAVADN